MFDLSKVLQVKDNVNYAAIPASVVPTTVQPVCESLANIMAKLIYYSTQ